MKSAAKTVNDYLKEIGPEKAAVLSPLIDDIRSVIHPGFEECMNWGMISYQVPFTLFPDTYNHQPLLYCALAAQKRHFSIYLMPAYSESSACNRIIERYNAIGLKLDMGKCCLRFKELKGVDRGIVKEVIASYDVEGWIRHYHDCRG